MTAGRMVAEHRVFVVRCEDHDVRVPVPGGAELLGCGPHVGEADFVSLWESAVVVGLLDRLGNPLWVLALDSQLGSQLVIRQDGFDRPRIEADRRSCAWIVSYRA